MGFIAASFAKAASAVVGVIVGSRKGFLAAFGPLAEANPREFRWAIKGLLWIVGLLAFGGVLWLLLPKLLASESEDIRNYGLVVAGLLAIPLAMWRSFVASRQAQTANRQAEISNRQADIAERGQVTDRFSKAVEQLAQNYGDGEEAKPNLTVRIGAIYALGRIANDSPEDAQTVFDVISAYVRAEFPVRDTVTRENSNTGYSAPVDHIVRSDLQAVMTVCRTVMNGKSYRVDFSGCDLRLVNLNGTFLIASTFKNSILDGGSFIASTIVGTDLVNATFHEATLSRAQIAQGKYSGVEFDGAMMSMAKISGDFRGNVRFVRTNCKDSTFARSDLAGADFYGADLTGVRGWETVRNRDQILNLDKAINVPDSTC